MPLKLNVGLSRKIGDGSYGSRGASVNMELELESALIDEPAKLRERIRQVFGLVRASVTEELTSKARENGTPNVNGHDPPTPVANGTGRSTNGRQEKPVPPATISQVKAIFAITRALGRNVGALLRQRFQVTSPEKLTIRQASALIDELKHQQNGDPQGDG
jgi:hypothetical protein